MTDQEKRACFEEVRALKGLIDYQEGSIVSKTLIEKNIGTLTIFAFSKGQALSEHTAAFDATIYVVEGISEIIISGVSYKVKEGEMIIMPADKPHAVRATENFKMLLIMIKGEDIKR